jgi:hypothetical protein
MSNERAAEATVEREGPTKAEPMSNERAAEATVERERPTKAEPMSNERAAEATVEREGPTKAPTKATSGKVRSAKTSSAANSRRTQRRAGCGDHRRDQTNRYFAHHGAHSIFLSTPSF